MGSNSFIGEDQGGPAPWRQKVSASKSASLSVMTHLGWSYQQSVQVDWLMLEHDWRELTHSVHAVGVSEKGTFLLVPVPDYFCHGCINSWLWSPFLCQSVSAFSGQPSCHSDPAQSTAMCWFPTLTGSRKYWKDQRCTLVSSWLPNELNSASSRSQSSSEWITG